MAFGPRKECENLVRELSATIAPGVSRKVDYLVVDSIGNEQWLHSSYGTKILRAVELRHLDNLFYFYADLQWDGGSRV